MNKSLEELENNVWNFSEFPSTLVKRCYDLRKIPIYNLEIEDIRLLLTQQIGIVYLVPIAIKLLFNNILSEGNFYPGDLLKSVLKLPSSFWKTNKQYTTQICKLLKKNLNAIKESKVINSEIKQLLLIDAENFLRKECTFFTVGS